MTRRRLAGVIALGVVLAFTACDLNPQPLPPLDPENALGPSADAGSNRATDAALAEPPSPSSSDAGVQSPPDGTLTDGGESADGGELTDGGADASSDAGDAGDAS